MIIYEENDRMYRFDRLPAYASYLLNNHVDQYTSRQIALARNFDLPIMRHFKHLSEEELFTLSRTGTIEFLTAIEANDAKTYIHDSMERWLANQLPNMQMFEVEARDITLINHLRGKTLKEFLPGYTLEVETVMELVEEMDRLLIGITTTSADIYLQMMKDKIEQESHFSRNIIQTSPGITFVYDALEHREIFITGKVQEVMGFTPDEILAMPNLLAAVCHPDDLPVVAAFMEALQQDKTGKAHHADYRFKKKDGSYAWLRCYAVVYKHDEAGNATEILGVSYDITREKQTALALEKREKQLLEAQQIGQIGSYEWDLVNDTAETSPQVSAIFEAGSSQKLDVMMQRVNPQDQQKLRDALDSAMKTGIYECEYRYKAPSGEKIIDSKGVVSFNANGKPLSLVGTIQDVTVRRLVEKELDARRAELERSNEALEQFAYAASHDLKEPLRKIILFSEMIEQQDGATLSKNSNTSLQKINAAAHRLQHLVEGVLSYSTINNETGNKVPCSLQELLQHVKNNLELSIKESGAVIETDTLPELEGYPLQLERLFQNLLSNSIKFARPGTPPVINIHHSFAHDAGGARSLIIDYRDNGIGFSNDHSHTIFNVFKRLHSRHEYEGSGVGLATCKKILAGHGGDIVAEGKPGEGARFIMTFPVNN
jgi:PAS domain S-box-containing protein